MCENPLLRVAQQLIEQIRPVGNRYELNATAIEAIIRANVEEVAGVFPRLLELAASGKMPWGLLWLVSELFERVTGTNSLNKMLRDEQAKLGISTPAWSIRED